jgi:hypothetical protein
MLMPGYGGGVAASNATFMKGMPLVTVKVTDAAEEGLKLASPE